MKYIAPTAALALIATQSMAGTLTEPVVEEVMEPTVKSSSAGWMVPVLLLGVAVLAIAANGDDDEEETCSVSIGDGSCQPSQ